MDRRSAITSMITLAVAPALIKIEMLMPVKAIMPVFDIAFMQRLRDDPGIKGIRPMNQIAMLQIVQDFYNMEQSFIIERALLNKGHNYLKGERY